MSEGSTVPADQPARDAIIGERARNVVVVAGAGTGKTTTIIDRAVRLLAPVDAAVPLPINRLAAITFTRRAAGELRFRLRERLLAELEAAGTGGGARATVLADALSNLDTAFIGTIHGFADRLLRLRPVEAQLSPAYLLVEDNGELIAETFLRLRRGAETGSLRAELGRHAADIAADLLDETNETLRMATRAGIQLEKREGAFGPLPSLEDILGRMIDTRDVCVPLPVIPDPESAAARAAAAQLTEKVRLMRGHEFGHEQVRRTVHVFQRLAHIEDPAEMVRIVTEARRGRVLYKHRDFNDDETGWSLYKLIRDSPPGSVGARLHGPHRWLAARLVRLFPVVAAMYERVKEEHELVDYLDLLIKLRDLLRDDLAARRFYQSLFDHIFVDEFQDTDPLQCEIVFFLCEAGAGAADWEAVELQPGKLTIVGDPKQSIYRFRRADIAMYGRAAARLTAGGALEERLETNFRSRPELIRFFNDQLAAVLGPRDTTAFDPEEGRAYYEPLSAPPLYQGEGRGEVTSAPLTAPVHLVPYADDAGEGLLAVAGRPIEGTAMARYLHWLLRSGYPVRDPETNAVRPVQPSDIAVLAAVTTNLRYLLERLDELDIEYTARGGVLFLGHPIVRRYLLALRALADRDDGVARAALLQPPFFALDWADVVSGHGTAVTADTERRERFEAARELVGELRRLRHGRAPGATARDLIERTALGRTVTTGRNGLQILAALYEVAGELDRRAALEGRDFDGATELLREWAERPVFLDAPAPLGDRAVRILTVHQAKGLEFPVVVLWDGFETFSERLTSGWRVERTGQGWALRLGTIAVEHDPARPLLERERQFGEHERRRLYYVAATRARDLLVLPLPQTKSEKLEYATRALAAGANEELVYALATFRAGAPPDWARADGTRQPHAVVADPALDERLASARVRLTAASAAAIAPRHVPTAVTLEAARAVPSDEDADISAEVDRKVAGARFGPVFGRLVHRALDLALSGATGSVNDIVRLAQAELPTDQFLQTACEDADRALAALRAHGITADAGWTLRTEYPLVMLRADGKLMSGFVDLLGRRADDIVLIDFKTDTPRTGPLRSAYPTYARQLSLYAEALGATGWLAGRRLRAALLLTATGELRWLEP